MRTGTTLMHWYLGLKCRPLSKTTSLVSQVSILTQLYTQCRLSLQMWFDGIFTRFGTKTVYAASCFFIQQTASSEVRFFSSSQFFSFSSRLLHYLLSPFFLVSLSFRSATCVSVPFSQLPITNRITAPPTSRLLQHA